MRQCLGHHRSTRLAALASGLLVLALAAPALAQAPVAWSPSRDDAVIADSLPASHGVEVLPEQVLAGDRVMTGTRLLQRPSGLSRPAPARLQGVNPSELAVGQALPSVSSSPLFTGELPEGAIITEGPIFTEGEPIVTGGPAGCCNLECPADCCGNWQSCGPVHPLCLLPRPSLAGLEYFGGVQGFTGPANRGDSGSFGFHQGFNWGMPICGMLAWQWGVHATQSTFEGNYLTTEDRNQLFLTGGFFRRVDWGLQGGVVVDYLHDEWDYEADLVQLRGELSWLWNCKHEIGAWFTVGLHEANNINLLRPQESTANGLFFDTDRVTFEANDLFALFYRRQFACGGEGRLYGGFTANSQGLVGGDVQLPINPCWSVRSGFLYVVPDDRDEEQVPDFVEESWNVGISLVWTPWAGTLCGERNYCRPLLTVADNGSFVSRIVRE